MKIIVCCSPRDRIVPGLWFNLKGLHRLRYQANLNGLQKLSNLFRSAPQSLRVTSVRGPRSALALIKLLLWPSGVSAWSAWTSWWARARLTQPSKRTRGTATCALRRACSGCWCGAATGPAACSSSSQIITTRTLWVLTTFPPKLVLSPHVSFYFFLSSCCRSGHTKALPARHGGEEEAHSRPVAIWRHSNRSVWSCWFIGFVLFPSYKHTGVCWSLSKKAHHIRGWK